jgi:hypothetical protein
MVKVEANGAVQPKLSMKDTRGGDEKWKLQHLGVNKADEDKFTNAVAPRARKKTGALDPWANISIGEVKAIIDEVYGPGVHEVTADGPWVGLVHDNSDDCDNVLTMGRLMLDCTTGVAGLVNTPWIRLTWSSKKIRKCSTRRNSWRHRSTRSLTRPVCPSVVTTLPMHINGVNGTWK